MSSQLLNCPRRRPTHRQVRTERVVKHVNPAISQLRRPRRVVNVVCDDHVDDAARGSFGALTGLATPEALATIGIVTFEVVGQIENEQTIASGRGVKIRAFLRKIDGPGRWRKRKGVRRSDWRTASSGALSYIGTRPTVSAGGI